MLLKSVQYVHDMLKMFCPLLSTSESQNWRPRPLLARPPRKDRGCRFARCSSSICAWRACSLASVVTLATVVVVVGGCFGSGVSGRSSALRRASSKSTKFEEKPSLSFFVTRSAALLPCVTTITCSTIAKMVENHSTPFLLGCRGGGVFYKKMESRQRGVRR